MSEQQTAVRHITVSEAVARVIANVRLPRPYRGVRDAASPLGRKLEIEDAFEELYLVRR